MTPEQVFSLITSWARRIASTALLVYLVIYIVKLFGFNLIPGLATFGPQETGILLAGLAYALGRA
jgi:hypothetical protein